MKLTNTPKPDIPKTGDTGNVYRYALLALISLAVMVSLVMAKKSRNQKNVECDGIRHAILMDRMDKE